MNFFTNLLFNLNPQLYHRENQIARLFVIAFNELRDIEERKIFKNMLLQMAIDDHIFFIRLAKMDVELLIWLINGAIDVFKKNNEIPPVVSGDNFNLLPSASISLLRLKIDPIIIEQLYELSRKNKNKLKEIFVQNSYFIKLFRQDNKKFVDSIESFLNK